MKQIDEEKQVTLKDIEKVIKKQQQIIRSLEEEWRYNHVCLTNIQDLSTTASPTFKPITTCSLLSLEAQEELNNNKDFSKKISKYRVLTEEELFESIKK